MRTFAEAFATLGEYLNLPDDTATLLEQYACYTMFNSLPPNFDSLHQHILQANFESYIRKHATTPILASPSPVGYGWKLEDDQKAVKQDVPATNLT